MHQSLEDSNLTQQKLLNKINLEYEGSYYVGNKIITADKKYQILVRNDEDLTVVVSKYSGGSLEPGEISMDLVDNSELGYIEVYVSVGGIQSYVQYAEGCLLKKKEDEKIQILLDYAGCQDQEELFDNMGVSSMDELYSRLEVEGIDELLISYQMIPGYEESNSVDVDISGGSGINESINLAYVPYIYDIIPGNGIYTYTATSGGKSVEEEITISSIDEGVDDSNIFTYDATTGYITGIKDEYISYEPVQTYQMANPRYLQKGTPILNVPSEINGTIIKGIDDEAFYEIYNITRVILPDTIEYIGEDAMSFCEKLTYVNIPDSVVDIGSAFWQVPLKELYIPSSVVKIGKGFWYTRNTPKIINCEAETKPAGWDDEWLYYADEFIVNWGVSK